MNLNVVGQFELESSILQWLDELPPLVRNLLVMRFILMTSSDSGDFALTDEESREHFARFLCAPDFVMRRLARILTVRGVFSFLLEHDEKFSSVRAIDSDLPSLDSVQILRAQKSWRGLCQLYLSDEQLVVWLQAQPD